MDFSFDLKPVIKKVPDKDRDEHKTIYKYNSDIYKFLNDYRYQPKLTTHLDELNDVQFNQELLNKIVLWKLNRYVAISPELFKELDSLTSLERGARARQEPIHCLPRLFRAIEVVSRKEIISLIVNSFNCQ